MIANLFFLKESFEIDTVERMITLIDNMILAKNLAIDKKDTTYIDHNTFHYHETPLGFIYELYTQGRSPLPSEYAMRLSELLMQNSSCEDEIADSEIADLCYPNANNGFIGLDFNHLNMPIEKCITDEKSWYHFHRQYFAAYPPTRVNFCTALSPYFINIYFNTFGVSAGLRGLHTHFSEIMKTIIHHLSAINDDFYDFFMREGMSGDKACDLLENKYRSHIVHIRASRDRNDCKDLDYTFLDKKTGIAKVLYCDLHTKFYQYFEYNQVSYQAKGNRIYFHQPIENFIEGKILLGRIGKHSEH